MIKKVLGLLLVLSIIDGTLTVLRFGKQTGSIKFYDSSGTVFYESVQGAKGYQTPVKLDRVTPSLIAAVLSAEDARFYHHFGLDIRAVARAIFLNVKFRRIISGASTITQQTARQHLAANTGLLSAKIIRKLREVNSALYLEAAYTKQAILETYLTDVYLGHNCYGVEACAQVYFSKSAQDLTLTQSAFLASVIKQPYKTKDFTQDAQLLAARNNVLALMVANNYLSLDQKTTAEAIPLELSITKPDTVFIHFAEYALAEAKRNGLANQLNGAKIYTTLNQSIAAPALATARGHVKELQTKHNLTNAAGVVIAPSDGAILALIGSIDYFSEPISGAVNMVLAKRQPGSALKPITYAQAFYTKVLTPDSTIIDQKTVFTDREGKSYVPLNYNGVFNGPVTARVALASSLNVPAVQVLAMVGVDSLVNTAQKLGLKSLDNPKRYDLSVTLGGGEVTLLELSTAYASLANNGAYTPVYSVIKVVDVHDTLIYDHKSTAPVPVWGTESAKVSDEVYSILSDPTAKVLGFGRNNVLTLPFQAASKTGTTTDWHDNWTLGYTKGYKTDFVVGVWVGNADNSPMYNLDGVTGAGPIWRAIMLETFKVLGNELVAQPKTFELPQPSSTENASPNIPVLEPNPHITNPANNTVFYLTLADKGYEKIKFEFTGNRLIDHVKYKLNGEALSSATIGQNFEYLWSPKAGRFSLEAEFFDQAQHLLGSDQVNFTVIQEQP